MKKILILFGAGKLGEKALGCKDAIDCDEVVFCDNSIEMHNTIKHGIRIVDINEVLDLAKDNEVSILITTVHYESIYWQCHEAGLGNNIIGIFVKNRICNYEESYEGDIYSQDGEECFLREMYLGKKDGVYVDVGAHHPFRFSNTYWCYKQGWHGINIEPSLENYNKILKYRERDINLNCGIGEKEGVFNFFTFSESGVNSFVDKMYPQYEFLGTREVLVRRLDEIFREYNIKKIDFIDIDVEGTEISVLKSIDWENIQIDYILLEQGHLDLAGVLNSEECKYLSERGYAPSNKFYRTVIYEAKKEWYP